MAKEDGRVIIKTKLDTNPVEEGIKKLNAMLKTGLTAAISGIGINTLKKAVQSIAEQTTALSDSIRKASTLFGDVDVNTTNLRKKMQELAVATGISSDEIGTALYDALSSGIKATEDMGDALSFIEKSARLATAGFADLQSTVKATASILNAYSMDVSEVDRVQSILMQTQNLGITTVAELSSYLAEVIPTASSYSVSLEQVGAALATMTAMGTKTTVATSSLNAMIAELGKNGMKASENLKKSAEMSGLGAKSFKELSDDGYSLVDILMMMDKYAVANGLSLVDMFGGIEAGKSALQLTTKEGEKFNEVLAVMSESSNLVDEAFDRILTNSTRLKTAWSELLRLFGSEFSSSTENLAGSLADILEYIIADNKEIYSLNKALSEFSDIVSADDSMHFNESLMNTGKAFENLATSTDKLIEDAKAMQSEYDSAFEEVTKKAKEYGTTVEAVAEAYRTGQVEGGIYHEALLQMYEEADSKVNELPSRIEEANKKIEAQQKALGEYAKQIATVAKDSNVNLEVLKETSTELYGKVMAYNRATESASDNLAKFGDNVEEVSKQMEFAEKMASYQKIGSDAWIKWTTYADIYSEALKAATDDLEKLKTQQKGASDEVDIFAESYNDITKALEDADKTTLALGKAFDSTGSKISIATNGVKKLISMGIDPADERIQSLVASINAWSSELEDSDDEVWNQVEALKDLNDELVLIRNLETALGDNYDDTGAKIEAYTRIIEEMVENGIDPASEEIEWLNAKLTELKKLASEPIEITFGSNKAITKTLEDFFSKETMAKNIGSALSSGFSAVTDSIASASSALEELDNKILEHEKDISDAQKERLELQEELADAQARGDEDAIKKANKRLSQIDDQIENHKKLKKALEDEKESIKSGAKYWEEFGKAALLSLAGVLEALGAQLAAHAVEALLKLNFAGAVAATAGSVAAYAAAAAVKTKANSFATGGIVQQERGLSSSGDNHIAYVNPGELILNQAQQNNLADQIRAMNEGLGAGGNIIISLSGAYIYGLDEPAVGRAIYDNIERLRSEGVL